LSSALRFFQLCCLLGFSVVVDFPLALAQQVPVVGVSVPELSSFDYAMTSFLSAEGIPGGALAVANDGRLLLAHGYGYADLATKQAVTPNSLFRVASLSKLITAVAVLKLVEEGKLSLDDKAFTILSDLKPPAGESIDPRIATITVRELLQHSEGWDRDKSPPDAMFRSDQAAAVVGAPAPASCETIIRYMLGRPLDFDPGTKQVYSDFGYCVLGRVIEKVTGQDYEQYVQSQLLAPAGVTDMRIGHSLLAYSYPTEVHYYDYPGARMVSSVFPNTTGLVPAPYGGFYLEADDSMGGWIATPTDYVRFILAINGTKGTALLNSDMVQVLISRPAIASGYSYYAMGVNVTPESGSTDWWHYGSLPGTTTYFIRTSTGVTIAAFFNLRPSGDKYEFALNQSLWQALAKVKSWPTIDLFTSVSPTSSQTNSPVDTAVVTQSSRLMRLPFFLRPTSPSKLFMKPL